ncbi:MAG: peptide ABC transporter substrate-binding protein [Candidatus Rokuibacteriota bacterium]|nr:MAG: peptide ABC transporter substrate-binding protein [Candidatus Rokubacteria bacterium]
MRRHDLSRRHFLTGAATLGATLGAVGVRGAGAQAPGAPQKGGQVIVGLSQEPQNFNPVMPTIEAQRGVHMAIYDDLWRIDPKGAFVPNLAAAIPTQANGGVSKDGTSFTVKLRPGVQWHDGQPFTARDVVFTWKTIMNPKVTAFSTVGFDQIADMWTGDDATLKFKLKQPYAPILDILADMFVVPEHVLARSADINKDEFNTRRPVGTGPFKFVEWVSGDHVTLEAHRAYHGPGPYLDRLIFKYVPDLTVLFTQLKTGEVDATGIQGIPVDLYPEARTLSTINLYVDPSTSYETIAPNHLLPMFKDRRMRQALYLGLDKKPIVEKIYLGLAPEAESYVPPQSWAYNPKIKGHHRYDPERAKRLLDEIGWKVGPDGIRVKDGARLSFENACTAGNKQREQIQQLLQQQWRQIGVEMKINNKPAAVLFGDFYRMSKFETIVIGMGMGSDPEHSFRLHSKYIPAKGGLGRNSIAYENPEVDRLLDAGVRDLDREKRKTAYFRLQEVLADEVPYLPIYHFVNIRGTRKGLEGFRPNSNMQEYPWNTNEWWIRKA